MTERYGWDQTPTPDLGLDITKAPSDIQKLYKWVIEKMYGEDVASAYGQAMVLTGILAKNAEAMSLFTSGQMDTLKIFVDSMLLEMTDKDVISAPEIIEARGGKPTLDDRLKADNEHFELSIGDINSFRQGEDSVIDKVRAEFTDREVNVKWFMSEGLTDLEAFTSACSFLEGVGGGTLYIPNGRYYVWGLEIPSNVKVIGQSNEHTIIDSTPPVGDYKHGFHIRNQQNVTIENIRFENVLALYNQFNRYAIECAGENDNIVIKRCSFYNVGGGVFLGYKDVDGVYYPSKNGMISECYFDTITNTHAIMVMQCDDVIVSNNRFENIESIGVRLAGSRDCVVEKNYIKSARVGISVQAFGDAVTIVRTSERATVELNNIQNCRENYIEVFNESHHAVVRNNMLTSSVGYPTRQYGINVTLGATYATPINYITIEANTITGMNTGIRVVDGHKFVYIENNIISDLKLLGTGDIPQMIDINGNSKSTDISILNNKLVDILTPVAIGIRADYTTDKVKIFGNIITMTQEAAPLSWSQANMTTTYTTNGVTIDTNIITRVD